jgi:GNAT superfamily N-acetyltransferase
MRSCILPTRTGQSSPEHQAEAIAQLRALLLQAPVLNAWLLHRLDQDTQPTPEDSADPDFTRWVGVTDGQGCLRAAAYVRRDVAGGPATMCSPAGDPDAGAELGLRIALDGGTWILVGERELADEIWRGMGKPAFRIAFDQRHYACTAALPGPQLPLCRATTADGQELARAYLEMLAEDLGITPDRLDADAVLERTLQRISIGHSWLARNDTGELQFTVDLSPCGRWGAQVGGTYVPPTFRGKGFSTAAIRALCNLHLPSAGPLTLHVNEANQPAVACYERVGFVRGPALRLFAV